MGDFKNTGFVVVPTRCKSIYIAHIEAIFSASVPQHPFVFHEAVLTFFS